MVGNSPLWLKVGKGEVNESWGVIEWGRLPPS